MSIFNIYKNKKVIVTGHTGFKGAWLTFCLLLMGAKVLGISRNIITSPSLFKTLGLQKKIKNKFLDIKNFNKVKKTFQNFKPDFVFHLAAQSLVKKSFEDPIDTFMTNSFGTMNILHILNNLKKKCCAVIITSDKCYLNIEQKKGYKESDRLGGYDPYSASKASAEIIIKCYQKSYLQNNSNIYFAVARAGNVIGGGDWSANRLIPDCVKAWSKNNSVKIRNPKSTRPWQHVLEAVFAYLFTGVLLTKKKNINGEAFNFGPSYNKNYSTQEVLSYLSKNWPTKTKINYFKKTNFKESNLLKLNCLKAKKKLGWSSILTFKESLSMTVKWYSEFYYNKKKIEELTREQIEYYKKIFYSKIKKI